MLVSCKQEISGNLTVTDIKYDAFQTTTETYYYKVTGSVKEVEKQTQTTRISATASEETASIATTTREFNEISINPVVTVTVSKDPTKNYTEYTINVPALQGKETRVTNSGTNYMIVNRAAESKTITKIGSTFYYSNANGEKVVIEGFDPTAATLDLSKLSEKDKTTSTTAIPQYTTSGELWYSTKLVITTTPTYSLTYTKL